MYRDRTRWKKIEKREKKHKNKKKEKNNNNHQPSTVNARTQDVNKENHMRNIIKFKNEKKHTSMDPFLIFIFIFLLIKLLFKIKKFTQKIN